jgi:DNA-binding beta-propeller fold protein YncE
VKRWRLSSATGVVGAFGSIWATGLDGVIRIDPATNRVTARIAIASGAAWTAASDAAVWVTSLDSSVKRIDPETNEVTGSVPLTGNLGDPAFVAGRVWVPEVQQDDVALVDPSTLSVDRVKAGRGPFVVTEVGGEAWVPSYKGRDVWRFTP